MHIHKHALGTQCIFKSNTDFLQSVLVVILELWGRHHQLARDIPRNSHFLAGSYDPSLFPDEHLGAPDSKGSPLDILPE